MNARLSRALSSGIAAVTAAVALLAGAPARAALVSFDYTGQAANGATVQGKFGWDTAAPVAPATIGAGGKLIGVYYLGGGFLTGQVSGGVLDGESLAFSGLDWDVTDRDPAVGDGGADAIFVVFSGVSVSLRDYSQQAISSLALPTTLDLADWDGEKTVRLIGNGGLEDFTLLDVKASQAVPTSRQDLPEPGSLALMTLAAGCAVVAARRRPQR